MTTALMTADERSEPADVALLGRLAARLAEGTGALGPALDLLVDGLHLTGATLLGPGGIVLARSDAEVVPLRRPGSRAEVPVGPAGARLAVTGADRSARPALEAAASVLALALGAASWRPAAAVLALGELDHSDLADALHDGPVQQLVVARYAADAAVRAAATGAAADQAREVRDAVQAGLVELRRMMWHLRPRGQELGTALEELSLRLAEAGRRILRVTVLPGGADLAPPAAGLAYRLVQATALTGRGTDQPLGVTLSRHGPDVLVAVDAVVPRADGVRLRAEALGGELRTSGRGTHLLLPGLTTHPAAPDLKASS